MTSHNVVATAGVKSRLPMGRLVEARFMNTRIGREQYGPGFGDATPPDLRPRCPVVQLKGRG
jgi:hypothetical protein